MKKKTISTQVKKGTFTEQLCEAAIWAGRELNDFYTEDQSPALQLLNPLLKELRTNPKPFKAWTASNPISQPVKWLEVEPVKSDGAGGITVCEPSEAEFWSVYARYESGTCICIADRKTMKAAYKYYRFLTSLIMSYLPNDEARIELAFKKFIQIDKKLADEISEFESNSNGHPFMKCTIGAMWLKTHFFPSGKVVGYSIYDNETATLGKDEEGHDFLLWNGYIIDFWHIVTLGDDNHPHCIKLSDKETVSKLYGDPMKWEEVPFTPEYL